MVDHVTDVWDDLQCNHGHATREEPRINYSLVTITLLPIAVAAILVIVQDSLAVAFGLAGIAWAVRFRNALEDTKDAMYVVGAIAVGLGAGVAQTGGDDETRWPGDIGEEWSQQAGGDVARTGGRRCVVAGGGRVDPAGMSLLTPGRLGTVSLIAMTCLGGVDSVLAQSDSASPSTGRALPHYDLTGAGSRRFKLPSELNEISGLTFTPDGSLLAHGDERGVIWQIDPATGVPTTRFGLGSHGRVLHGDFEDIQVVGKRVFLVTSQGRIFEAGEPANKVVVDAIPRTAGLAGACEVEGLAWDPPSTSLLVLCKHAYTKRWRRTVVVLAVSIETWQFEAQPRMLIREEALERVTGEKQFHGSAIVRHPRTGTYLMLAGPQHAYAEVSPKGAVLGGGQLPSELHPQPEGIAVGPDLTLYISDEGAGKHATLTAYAYRP